MNTMEEQPKSTTSTEETSPSKHSDPHTSVQELKAKLNAINDEKEKWFFSIVDIIAVLTEQEDFQTARKYWNKLAQRLREEGNESVTNYHQLKMLSSDGKMRLTDVADTF